MRLFKPLLISAALALAPLAAAADEKPPLPDTVNLSLSAEGWIEAAKARVRVAVNSAQPADQAGTLRASVKETLARLVPGAEWHVTGFDRSRDQAGLERWRIEAEARVPETALDGLYDRAKELSRPGEQVAVDAIDFTPEVAERESVMSGLRAKIYAEAKAEIGRLSGVYPDRSYRVREIAFGGGPVPMPVPMMKTARAAPMAEAAAGAAPIGVAQHVVLTANVVLAAEPPGK